MGVGRDIWKTTITFSILTNNNKFTLVEVYSQQI